MPDIRVLHVAPGDAGYKAVVAAMSELLAGGSQPIAVLGPGPNPVPAVTVRPPAGTDLLVATSGSTGDPTAVALPRAALESAATGVRSWLEHQGVARPLRWVASLPLTGIGGLMCIFRSMLDGGAPWPAPWLGGAEPFTAEGFAALTAGLPTGGWAVSLVPTMLDRLLADRQGRAALTRYDLVLVGGAAMPEGLQQAGLRAGIRVVSSYGMTETAGGVVLDGQPVPNVSVTADGAAAGRLVVTGPMVGLGYLDGRLAQDWEGDHRTSRRSFRTRDLGLVGPGGTVSVLGRVDDVVQVGGVNVDVGAVGRVLADHPDVAEATVVAVPDLQWGMRLVAYVVTRAATASEAGGAQLAGSWDTAELANLVRSRLGRPAVPGRFESVQALPRLPGGKVDRAELGRRAAQPR